MYVMDAPIQLYDIIHKSTESCLDIAGKSVLVYIHDQKMQR